ncbi:hypothetical protein M0802_001664 [Mischocyttarus mexicanus]|nr:hypothetical protein M0802_001664 [Mischocyttarus mexicanus]
MVPQQGVKWDGLNGFFCNIHLKQEKFFKVLDSMKKKRRCKTLPLSSDTIPFTLVHVTCITPTRKIFLRLRRVRLLYDILILETICLSLFSGVRGLTNVSVDIPVAVAAGTTVNMSCRYDLETDSLYAVKWYNKANEFFQYVPKEEPPIQVFGDLGAKVVTNQSNAKYVTLKDVQPINSGKYRCEVSEDFPTFSTISVYDYMQVANLPKSDPEVNVEKLRYAVGDTVRGNCTVSAGNPPANITWTVNGYQPDIYKSMLFISKVNSSFLINITDKFIDDHHMAIAGLDFEIASNTFSNGKLHVVCNANVYHLYEKKAEVLLMEERPILASVLGTRESSYIGTLALSCTSTCIYIRYLFVLGNAARRVEEWFCASVLVTLLLCNLR